MMARRSRTTESSAGKTLNARELRFALHYAMHSNITAAAKHAGYADRSHCSRKLKEPHVAEVVARAREALVEAREKAAEAPEWAEMLIPAKLLLYALVTGALRTDVDPRLLRVELDAAREVVLRAEGAVPQTVLTGDLAHMAAIQAMSDDELERFRRSSPEEQARMLGMEMAPLLSPPREEPQVLDAEVVEDPADAVDGGE